MYGVRTRASPATLQCDFCSRSFSRQEHLSRHLRIHTREKPFSCSLCEKSFARLDVLNRHKAAAHDEGRGISTSAAVVGARACLRCASDRVRCSRHEPCHRCSQRGFHCQFPASRSVQRRIVTSVTHTSPALDVPDSTQSDCLADESLGTWPCLTDVPAMDFQNSYSMPGLGLSDINWLSPQYHNTLHLDDFLAPPFVDYNLSTLGGPSAVANTDHAVNISPSSPPPTVVANASNLSATSDSDGSMLSSENRYYVDGSGARAPFPKHPPKTYGQDVLCPPMAYEALLHALRSEDQAHSMGLELASLPTIEQVRHFVSKYFDNFHPNFPFLRRSSFAGEASSSWILLAAVAMTGSRFCHSVQDETAAYALSQVLGLALKRCSYGLTLDSFHADEDLEYSIGEVPANSAEPPLHILRAGVLNIACMLYSGKQALFERGLVERHFLVEACRKFGSLSRNAEYEPIIESDMAGGTSATEKRFAHEATVRLVASLWALDTLLAYEFQAAPALTLHAMIPLDLPVAEEIWDRPLMPQSGNIGQSSIITFGEALEMLYVEKKLPPDLGDFSTWLLILAIYRKTADVVAQDRIRLNFWTPSALPQRRSELSVLHQEWLPATRMAMKWRNSACDCLDILHWPANSRIAYRSGFEHHTILQLHLARIIILTPTNYIQTLARGFATTGDFASGQARLQVLQWVIQDHCKAKLSVVHCGALFWHVRRYSCDSLLEPYAIYIATLVLWAFCVSMQLHEVAQAIASDSDETPEPSFLHLDRPLDDELVQTYVRLGHKMSAHMANIGCIQEREAPKRIAKEGLRLLAKRAQEGHHEPDLTLDAMIQAACTWGIERSYRRALASLTAEDEQR